MAQHSSKSNRFWAVTGSELLTGEVVYFNVQKKWVKTLQNASIADGKEQANALLDVAQTKNIELYVVDIYLLPIAKDETTNNISAASVRELIRAKGPTVRKDLGKQAD